MKPIQTEYKGYKFRSRLEAKWAVFFDALGLDWEYEPEGFELSDGRYYLPDFLICNDGRCAWYEVKPTKESDDGKMGIFEKDYFDSLESQGLYNGKISLFMVLSGDPYDSLGGYEASNFICPRCGLVLDEPCKGSFNAWACGACDIRTPGGGDNDAEIGLFGNRCFPHKGAIELIIDDDIKSHSLGCYKAAKKARSARFEHGETPA